MGIDFLLSYMLILKTSLSILSNDCHLKTLNTCISHLSAVALFFTLWSACLYFTSLAQDFLKHLCTHGQHAFSYSSCDEPIN